MVDGSVRSLMVVALCAAATLAFEAPNMLAESAPPATPMFIQMPPPRPLAGKPVLRGGIDVKRAWLGAEYRGLIVRKSADRVDGSMTIELQFSGDLISIALNRAGGVAVARAGRRLELTTVGAYQEAQQLLAGS
jgi:hypothetical protein